jgi:pimeloyl-ACP methyl ester carboxylesterase
MREMLYGLTIPRAYIFGERSLPDSDTEILATRGIQVSVVPKAGHAMMFDNPAGVAEAIKQTLYPVRT